MNVRFYPDELGKLLKGESGPVAKEILRAAIQVEGNAKRLAPVDTGRLRSSITHEVGRDGRGLYGSVGSDGAYAMYQEFGTRYVPAHPFLRPALDRLR